MDILLTEKSLRRFLKTEESIDNIVTSLTESGPTVDHVTKTDNETILQLEIITNRIDSASAFGVALEANAILNQKGIKSQIENDPYNHEPISNHQTSKINIVLESSNLVSRFSAVSIDSVNVKDSDTSLQELLVNIGQRPISNLVDITNEATMLYGLPSHIFDKDKLALQKLLIRKAKEGEVITLLDNSKLNLLPEDIVIEDGNGRLVDLLGCMGGKVAEVDSHTKNILLIVPVCDPKSVRKTSLHHQKRTLASQIFEKSPDPQLAPKVISLIASTIIDRAGGHLSSAFIDINNTKEENKNITLDLQWLNSFIGTEIKPTVVSQILNNLGFKNKVDTKQLLVQVPSFRSIDINNQEDLAEEVARIYGYKNITPVLPVNTNPPTVSDKIFKLERSLRQTLSHLGFSEVYNSSLISSKTITNSNLDSEKHLKLENALSEDMEYLRTSLLPSALTNHKNNKTDQNTSLNFFEIANVYLEKKNETPDEVPSLIITSNEGMEHLKKNLEKALVYAGYSNITFSYTQSAPNYFNTTNTVSVLVEGNLVGYLGQISSAVTRSFQLSKPIASAEINLQELNKIEPKLNYAPVSNFPDVVEDITVKSDKKLGELVAQIGKAHLNITKVIYQSSYQDNHTFRVYFNAKNRNLTQQETSEIKEKIFSDLKS